MQGGHGHTPRHTLHRPPLRAGPSHMECGAGSGCCAGPGPERELERRQNKSAESTPHTVHSAALFSFRPTNRSLEKKTFWRFLRLFFQSPAPHMQAGAFHRTGKKNTKNSPPSANASLTRGGGPSTSAAVRLAQRMRPDGVRDPAWVFVPHGPAAARHPPWLLAPPLTIPWPTIACLRLLGSAARRALESRSAPVLRT